MEPVIIGKIFSFIFTPWVAMAIIVLVVLKSSITLVPQNRAYVVERFGKFNTSLTAGLNFIVPFIDRIAYDKTLKEQAVDVPSQGAITRDNISLTVDGVLYLKVIDAYKASYGVEDYTFAVTQLAQTTMRSEIGKIELDRTFEERDTLNLAIVNSINEAALPWGVQVLRYEIKDINPPRSVLEAMERQMKAEREKRAVILESEGERQSAINVAEGQKQSKVLAAEADKAEQILGAEGEARAIELVAEAKANALRTIGEAAATVAGQKAVQLDLATKAIDAKYQIAKQSTIVLMDGKSSEASSTVAEAVAIVSAMNKSDAFSSHSISGKSE
ncbi:MAG: paraslipin [Zetaproteobacteria bacterium CG_4_9_14_3_um_filter_49_83]|nr:MAG: paraslipin [Zetaproteobacteria bacterium CG1_02_49_23]PIQ33551.1 MAG: paraslipin [Zetaproteobacteria bacterium CG17_big_fil_post_rev_8_21_14_2_50_50_13]PIY56533.1 MAG: paraslipin [Zetaproteobacteria bacterium CG_4_10_14_0_8_um_filter_49_80]PJA33715.1 MAG: paraslipin [Zetaproteobacteria bacterium CG_4_9_14_3_um_filter_49_83]